MWIALTISEFWDFCTKQKILFDKNLVASEYLQKDISDSEIWLELDKRYLTLKERFVGPILFCHIEKVIPVTKEAKDSITQLLAIFPHLVNYVRS
ncbi:MAG: hypothetical protein IPH11_03220 [Ignavibacteriales bacterium]|nr:hypothetical protein [Ignavibacteriales bacterium]